MAGKSPGIRFRRNNDHPTTLMRRPCPIHLSPRHTTRRRSENRGQTQFNYIWFQCNTLFYVVDNTKKRICTQAVDRRLTTRYLLHAYKVVQNLCWTKTWFVLKKKCSQPIEMKEKYGVSPVIHKHLSLLSVCNTTKIINKPGTTMLPIFEALLLPQSGPILRFVG